MKKRIGILMLSLFMTATIAGQNKNAPVNYDEGKAPAFELPDPLKCENGKYVSTIKQWEKVRRHEIMKLFSV